MKYWMHSFITFGHSFVTNQYAGQPPAMDLPSLIKVSVPLGLQNQPPAAALGYFYPQGLALAGSSESGSIIGTSHDQGCPEMGGGVADTERPRSGHGCQGLSAWAGNHLTFQTAVSPPEGTQKYPVPESPRSYRTPGRQTCAGHEM